MTEGLSAEIGERLKAARKEKGMSLNDVSAATKIQLHYLKSLEAGDFAALPGEFYVRAFIRQYARVLGLNPDELIGETDDSPLVHTGDLSHAHRDDDGVVRAGVDHTQSVKAQLMGWLPKIWIAIGVVVFLLIVWLVIVLVSNQNNQDSGQNDVQVSSSSVSKSSSSASSSSKKDELKLGKPTTNTSQSLTTYNLAGQQSKAHKLVIKGQNAGTTVKVNDATSKILFNQWVPANTEKTVDIPAGTTAVNVQVSIISNATLTLDDQPVSVPDLPNPTPSLWYVLFNFNK
ncbi:helix-turn-helix domain-containing protein [Leuconostocaceae bacterium ESL0723]|nr:helix-turn-helix domain-containing protein [Lactobacillaceae bacterium L1_55_11]WEV54139.1 helix-turn-helix domain-containing protein [Leuconostocaceae bacterium ESL0723]